jgi:parallel beta-helix repeat protein
LGIEGEKEMKGNEAWKKTKTILICSIILLMSMSSNFIFESVKAEGSVNIYYVPDDGLLQDFINTSQSNDIIQINETINLSSFIIINKSITVQGKNDELIHINGSNEFGFNINVTNVTMRNLTIQNCSTAITIENSTNSLENITLDNITIQHCSQHGIRINNTTLSNITNLTIINCTQTGIYLQNSSNNIISENQINQTSNTGINITSNSNNTIKNNILNNNSISINITSSENNLIYNNTFFNCSLYHAFDNSTNKWNTTTHGNYWADYTGTDGNDDDKGDTAYNITGGTNKDYYPLGFFVPIINFTFEPSSPTTSNTINFTDNSVDPNLDNNLHLNYTWDFETNGIIDSYLQNPSYTYTENDQTYTVSLNVTNQYGQSNQTNQTIIINNSAPTSLFTWSPQPGIVNETITFTSNCSDSDGSDDSLSYNWSFGEDSYFEQQDSTHTYNLSGDYSVILNVTDDDGNTTSYSETITVTFKPSVNFSFSPSSPSTSDTITFTDTSTDQDGSVSSWSWDFNDGNTSTEENPTHSYDSDGTYTVSLTVTDEDGATNQTNQEITVLNTPPTANFTYSPQNATDLQTITFTTCSTDPDGSITNCTWTFGDDTSNYSMNTTSHQYTDNGTYTVTLNVTDDDGDTDEYSKTITISNVGPTADFTIEPSNPEIGETIYFNDTSTDEDGSIASWSWDFDDESSNTSKNTTHTYSTLQSRDVTLTVTDNDGNSSSITKHLILKKTITKPIQSTDHSSFDLKEEADTTFCVKTSNTTNISVTKYSECPSGIDACISEYENLETYIGITLEDSQLLEWINFSLYYSNQDIDEDIDTSSLALFYYNETNNTWVKISDSTSYESEINGYQGFVQANITHLTLFTIAGAIAEEEETVNLTLPSIVHSSDNTTFTIANPTLNVTYDGIVPEILASLNDTTIQVATTDNQTFTLFIPMSLSNGNYTLQLLLKNNSFNRTDLIEFSINIPSQVQKSETPIEIPVWVWFSIIIVFGGALICFFGIPKHLYTYLIKQKQQCTNEGISANNPKTSQGILKDTLSSVQQSMSSFDALVFGSTDPWKQYQESVNHTLYNIDLFTEKPDAYVGIQEKLITEEPTCKDIINLLDHHDESIEEIKEKTDLSKEDLSKQLSILLKYGLIEEHDSNIVTLTKQAKELMKKTQ